VQLICDGDAKEYAVIFAKGDEAFSGLMEFAERYHIASGHFTAIGALSRVTLGWFDLQKKCVGRSLSTSKSRCYR